MKIFPALVAVLCALSSSLHADSWPQFRGTDGSATAVEGASIPAEWDAKTNVKWKTELPGPGSSSPIYWKDRLYLTYYTGYGTNKEEPGKAKDLGRKLVCLNRDNGDILWTKPLEVGNPEDDYRGYLMEHGYASSTPVTDGEHIYIFCGKSGVFAFTLDGEKVWNSPVGKNSAEKKWGSAASPILHGDLVIVNASDEGNAIIAFDKASGDERWRYESDKLPLCYNTPTVHTPKGGKAEIVISAPEELFALDPKTGKRLWFAKTPIPGNICPSVISAGETLLTTGGWPKRGTVAIKGGGSGDVTDKILWAKKTFTYVPTPVVVGENVQWVSDAGEVIVMSLATGDVVTKSKVEGLTGRKNMAFYASIVRAGDKLIAVSRRSGTFVFEANKGMKQIAKNDLGDTSEFNATPAVSKDALYLRSNKAVYCIGK